MDPNTIVTWLKSVQLIERSFHKIGHRLLLLLLLLLMVMYGSVIILCSVYILISKAYWTECHGVQYIYVNVSIKDLSLRTQTVVPHRARKLKMNKRIIYHKQIAYNLGHQVTLKSAQMWIVETRGKKTQFPFPVLIYRRFILIRNGCEHNRKRINEMNNNYKSEHFPTILQSTTSL